MPTAQRTRTIAASPRELWEVLGDPHHLPRWWPRVNRVEAVEADAFTEVLISDKGKTVRADFKLLDTVESQRVVWAQQIENTPFARVLKSAETEISIAEAAPGRARRARSRSSCANRCKASSRVSAGGSCVAPRTPRSTKRSTGWSGSLAAERMRWWGWGDPPHPTRTAAARAWLPARHGRREPDTASAGRARTRAAGSTGDPLRPRSMSCATFSDRPTCATTTPIA